MMNQRMRHLCKGLTCFVMAASLYGADKNIIPNAGFGQQENGQLAHWTKPDGLTSFWDKSEGVPKPCLHFDTDVYVKEWKAHQKNPDEPEKKTQPTGNRYDTVAGSVGVSSWSEPVEVEPGAWYLLEADVKGPGGSPFIYLKGFQKIDGDEAKQRGTLRFFKRHEKGPSFSVMVGGDEQREARAGDYIQTFRARLVCRLPEKDVWRHYERAVQIREDRFQADVVMLMVYAYWPAGDYFFDNVKLTKITAEEAAAVKARKTRHGTEIDQE